MYFERIMGSLTLVKQLVEENENSEFKLAVFCLKIDFMLHPVHDRIVG